MTFIHSISNCKMFDFKRAKPSKFSKYSPYIMYINLPSFLRVQGAIHRAMRHR